MVHGMHSRQGLSNILVASFKVVVFQHGGKGFKLVGVATSVMLLTFVTPPSLCLDKSTDIPNFTLKTKGDELKIECHKNQGMISQCNALWPSLQ
jgi:hypothetical protein